MASEFDLFARQPIFNRQLEAVAYELLFRSGRTEAGTIADGDAATERVLSQAFKLHRLSDLLGNLPVFINFTHQQLTLPPPLPPSQLVVEILEDVLPDEHILSVIARLRRQGYCIALDDFFIDDNTRPLVQYADIIKIDVLALTEQQLVEHVALLKTSKVQLLAEKIETKPVFELCKQLNFDYYQGYLLSKPSLVGDSENGSRTGEILVQLQRLLNQKIALDELLSVLDPALCESLALVAQTNGTNPALAADAGATLSNCDPAQLRNWAAIAVVLGAANVPSDLMISAAAKARFCENLGHRLSGRELANEGFLCGFLSTLDVLLALPVAELATQLKLTDSIRRALMLHQGLPGEILALVEHYEQANWTDLTADRIIAESRLPAAILVDAYGEALRWASQTCALLETNKGSPRA